MLIELMWTVIQIYYDIFIDVRKEFELVKKLYKKLLDTIGGFWYLLLITQNKNRTCFDICA